MSHDAFDDCLARLSAVASDVNPGDADEEDDAPPCVDIVVHADPEFDQLVQLGGVKCKRAFEQRSWEHAKNARSAKKLKRSETALAGADATSKRSDLLLAVASFQHGDVRRMGGSKFQLTPHQRSLMEMHIACKPPVSGQQASSERQSQNRCVRKVASFAEAAQKKAVRNLFFPIRALEESFPVSTEDVPLSDRSRHHLYEGQFDSTSQRLRSLFSLLKRLSRDSSHQQVLQHVMMQSGVMRCFGGWGDEFHELEKQPYLIKSTIMEHTTSDFVLETVLRGCPVPVADEVALRNWLTKCASLTLVFILDRASTNTCAMRWVAKQIFCLVDWESASTLSHVARMVLA